MRGNKLIHVVNIGDLRIICATEAEDGKMHAEVGEGITFIRERD